MKHTVVRLRNLRSLNKKNPLKYGFVIFSIILCLNKASDKIKPDYY